MNSTLAYHTIERMELQEKNEDATLGRLSRYADLLEEFMIVIFKHDPGKFKSPEISEYESEALSILSRFVEAGVQLPEIEGDVVLAASLKIVSEAFDFWFEDEEKASPVIKGYDFVPMTRELIEVLRSKFIDEDDPMAISGDGPDLPLDIPDDVKELMQSQLKKLMSEEDDGVLIVNGVKPSEMSNDIISEHVGSQEATEEDLNAPMIQVEEKK